MNKLKVILGKILLAIILLQLVPLALNYVSATAATGITIAVNQTPTNISADYYFENLTSALGFLSNASYTYANIIIEAGSYKETFSNTYTLHNVTIQGLPGVRVERNSSTLKLVLASSVNVTFTGIVFTNFTDGIVVVNSRDIKFTNTILDRMSTSTSPLSLTLKVFQTTSILETFTITKPRLASPSLTIVKPEYTILSVSLSGMPAILVNNTSNLLIRDITITDSYGGIFILNSTNITVTNTTIKNMNGTGYGGGGIGIYNSDNVYINNTTIENITDMPAIYAWTDTLEPLTDLTLTGIFINNSYNGITIANASNILLNGITETNVDQYSISIINGNSTIINNITCANTGIGVYATSSNNMVLSDVNIRNTVWRGIYLERIIDASINDTYVNNTSSIGIYIRFTDNMVISNATVERANLGIYIEYSSYVDLLNSLFHDIYNNGAVEVDESLNLSIINVTVYNSYNWDGIGLYDTNNTTLENIMVYDSLWSIYTWNANNISFENITVYSTGASTTYGIELEYSKNVSFNDLLVRNITEPDLWYVGAPFPIGLHAYYNSSITVFNASILDVYNASNGGVGILINNSSASLNKLYINNSHIGVMTYNNTSGLTIADTTIANTYYGVYLDNWTGNVSIILTEISNTVYGVFANKSNLTINNLRIHNNLQVGIDLYNASNASITNIYIDTANTGLLVDNVNWYYGVNVSVENATIITGAIGIHVLDISYASNITLNNITIQGGGVLVETDMSAWSGPPLYNLSITNLSITNVPSEVGLALQFNSTPLNLTLVDLEIRNSANGLLINGAGVSSGWGTISRVELANITSGPALVIENSTNLTLTNIYIHDTGSHGIVLGHSIGNVSNITIDNLGLANINGTPIIAENSTNISFTNTYISNPTIHIDYTIKGEANIYAVNTTIVPPPTGNETPLGIYANVTLGSTNSWILLSYTYPISLGYPIVKWMYYNETTNTWENMPTTIIPLNSTHNKVLTNHTGSTLLGVYGTPPPVGGKLELYTTKNNNPLPLILAAIGLTITATIIAYTLNKNKQK